MKELAGFKLAASIDSFRTCLGDAYWDLQLTPDASAEISRWDLKQQDRSRSVDFKLTFVLHDPICKGLRFI